MQTGLSRAVRQNLRRCVEHTRIDRSHHIEPHVANMSAEHDAEDYVCPLAAVDRRLYDVHRQWHQAEQAYFGPEGFRIAIQTAIQTLRTVTFILQNHKRIIPDFDNWYCHGWVPRLADDDLMRWMRDARNKIEKQGDLEAHSLVRAWIIASYLSDGPVIEVPAKLSDSVEELLRSIPDKAALEHIQKHGALVIERRWVENTLPDYELLDATAIAYGRIAEVVHDAHQQLGLALPATISTESGERYVAEARGGRMPCMIGHGDRRSITLSLTDGQPIEFERIVRTIEDVDAEGVVERYGDAHRQMFGPPGASEEEMAASLFETARRVFLIDGYHETMFFLFHRRELIHHMAHRPQDHRQKYLLMRDLAHEVERRGVDMVLQIGEVWTAKLDPYKPYMNAADAPDRGEALCLMLVTKTGDPVQFVAEIHRDGDEVSLGEPRVERNFAAFAYAPVYEAWGRSIPEAWNEIDRRRRQ